MGLDLVLVIDVSGSMRGSKLNLVKETLEFVINKLEDIDRVSLITFNNEYEILANLVPMSSINKRLMIRLIEEMEASGSTNIQDPLQAAIELLYKRRYLNDISSIFLLSDGKDN